jgi:hypothetical protein
MAKPVVIVVGADKGGVGKTTVSRTLLDYFDANNIPTRAFDTESPRGTLKRFHPDITEIVDMTTTSDQMKIFDTLNAAAPSVTVIDVRAGLMSPALGSLRDIGFSTLRSRARLPLPYSTCSARQLPRWTKSRRPRISWKARNIS